MKKKCVLCGEEKETKDFYTKRDKKADRVDLQSRCKTCHNFYRWRKAPDWVPKGRGRPGRPKGVVKAVYEKSGLQKRAKKPKRSNWTPPVFTGELPTGFK